MFSSSFLLSCTHIRFFVDFPEKFSFPAPSVPGLWENPRKIEPGVGYVTRARNYTGYTVILYKTHYTG